MISLTNSIILKKYHIQRYISWQYMNNYIYIVDERKNELYFIEGIAVDIWIGISDEKNINDIILSIDAKYCNDTSISITKLVYDFINKLLEEELIYES